MEILIQGSPILPGMSPAYEDLSSLEAPLSIFTLTNDYLMSGHCERDKQDVRGRRDLRR
jgi:hypothetical protein